MRHPSSLLLLTLAFGCGDTEPPPAEAPCDDSRRPLVMVHGFLAAGDTWAPHVDGFAAAGLCRERYHAFDWNSLDMQADHALALDQLVERVRERHGVTEVDLIGHSAGGSLGYRYLAEPARASKVARYVHVGSNPAPGPAGPAEAPVPTLNVWSPDDTVVEGDDIDGAANARLPGLDHYAVATAPEAFEAVYRFLYDEAPTEGPDPGRPERVAISGRALVLGENAPEEGAVVEVRPVQADTGRAAPGEPTGRFVLGEDGVWGPVDVEAGQPYVFSVASTRPGAPVVRYYREPFTRPDHLVYLRTLPTPPSLAGALLAGIPFDDAHPVLVVFSASRAILEGVDSLKIDGEELATPELASAEDTTIALFVYDEGKDRADGAEVGLFSAFPFLSAVDRFLDASLEAPIDVSLNGRRLAVPRWPSATEGATIVVFD